MNANRLYVRHRFPAGIISHCLRLHYRFALSLEASTVTWPDGGTVHAGVADAFNSVRAKVRDWLAHPRDMKAVFTGHSLGRALATLAASQWTASNVITFGSPSVGNAAFADTVKADAVARYVDCCDIVTRVPPKMTSYPHVGSALYIENEIEAARTTAWMAYRRDDAWRIGTVLFRDLADHAPINYERALLPPCEAA